MLATTEVATSETTVAVRTVGSTLPLRPSLRGHPGDRKALELTESASDSPTIDARALED